MDIYDKQLSEAYSDLKTDLQSADKDTLQEFYKNGIADKKVLDFGCGDGRYDIKFAQDGAEEVIGVDISSSMIDLARKRLEEFLELPIKFFKIENTLPFGDSYFDSVFSNFVLHYVPDLSQTFKEIHRVLKPGGNLVAILNIFEGQDIPLKAPIVLGKMEHPLMFDIFARTEDDIIKALKSSGFSDISFRYVNNPDAKIIPNFKGELALKTILLNVKK